MVINGEALLRYAPIKDMERFKTSNGLVSSGISEAGYDIRLKQEIHWYPDDNVDRQRWGGIRFGPGYEEYYPGNFCLASAIEEFQMPPNLVGIVHDKSTWARKGLSVFNTVIEPGWKGFLTLELVFNGREGFHIPAGSGIAQVIFHETILPADYDGKYQDQEDRPVDSKFA